MAAFNCSAHLSQRSAQVVCSPFAPIFRLQAVFWTLCTGGFSSISRASQWSQTMALNLLILILRTLYEADYLIPCDRNRVRATNCPPSRAFELCDESCAIGVSNPVVLVLLQAESAVEAERRLGEVLLRDGEGSHVRSLIISMAFLQYLGYRMLEYRYDCHIRQ